jgi:hypothetical protein
MLCLCFLRRFSGAQKGTLSRGYFLLLRRELKWAGSGRKVRESQTKNPFASSYFVAISFGTPSKARLEGAIGIAF